MKTNVEVSEKDMAILRKIFPKKTKKQILAAIISLVKEQEDQEEKDFYE